ncbi:NUDIX domain-containing protein [Lysobacter enzymogenes]|uniref:NUDIX domain-containing protein n=1 Tax=Lysobacter enzymogenes TaxID=69 RepID=UPI0019D1302D
MNSDAAPRIGWVGALLLRDGRVLLGLRALHKRLAPGRWDLPGGHVEPGETPEQALWRELAEETGIGPPADPATAARIAAEFAFDGVVLRLYAVRDWVGEPRPLGDEHLRLQWFEPVQAAALPDLSHPRLGALLRRLA